MKNKAEQLIDRLREIGESQEQILNEEPLFELGDVVTINRDEYDYVAIVEAIDGDKFTVRVQAIAGNEFEATDKVYVVDMSELSAYDAPKGYAIGDKVEWKSEAGITVGEIVGTSDEGYMIEVFAPISGRSDFEQTHVIVTLSGEYLSKSEAIFQDRAKPIILSKMSDVTMSVDEKRNVGILEGIASTYGNVDLGGDTVKKGAYTQTLGHKKGRVKMFADHGWNMKTYLGIVYLSDSDNGLMFKAELPLDATDVRNDFIKTQFTIESGEDMGVSIGYDAVKYEYKNDGTRELQEIALHEVSITPFPMDTHARILSARSKRIAYKAMQMKWQTPKIDAPKGNQGHQGAELTVLALAELKSILKPNPTQP